MKILSNCELSKLKEYAKSYGNTEVLNIPFIHEYENTIICYNKTGKHLRTFKKGTKLLVSFKGKEISQRSYKMRINKAIKAENIEAKEKLEKVFLIETISQKKHLEQSEALKNIFINDSLFLSKIKNMISELSSQKWRKKVKLKVCQKIANEKFNKLFLTPTDIRNIALSI